MTHTHWKELLESSEVFVCVVDKSFFKGAKCVEQAIYAKNLKKKFVLIIEKGTVFTIPDMFKDVDIIFKCEYVDYHDLAKSSDKMLKALNNVKKNIKK